MAVEIIELSYYQYIDKLGQKDTKQLLNCVFIHWKTIDNIFNTLHSNYTVYSH